MKAVILAAGKGTRLGVYAKNKPKTLVEINGIPLLDIILKNLIKEEVKDVLVITGYKSRRIKEFIEAGYYRINIDYLYNKVYNRTNNIYSLYLAKKRLENSEFLIINSDVLFHKDILKVLRGSSKSGVILSIDLIKKLGHEEMKVIIEDNTISKISKEISPSIADGEYIGLAKIDKKNSRSFFEFIEKTIEVRGKKVFYEEAFQMMIDNGYRLQYESTERLPWVEIDTPEDLKIAREIIAPRITRKDSLHTELL